MSNFIEKREVVFMEKDVVLEEVKKGVGEKYKEVIDTYSDLFYYTYRKGIVDCFKYYNK